MTLVRLDENPIPVNTAETRAFLPARNERARLPYCLTYHRKLGIDRFFVVDNGSTDGTLDYLLDQKDCHVFSTQDSFAKANYGVDWMNALLDLYGTGGWCLTIDADELFTYPGCEAIPIGTFARNLEALNADGVFAFLLDMYSATSITETQYESDQPFTDVCPFFDADYKWRKRPQLPFDKKPWPAFEIEGGPRLRCFYPELRELGFVPLNLHRIGLHCRLSLAKAPALTKIPFVKWRGCAHYLTNHRTTRLRLAAVTAVLMHFKFMSDFLSRTTSEAGRAEHYKDGIEYARYMTILKRNQTLTLIYPGSVRYENSQQLVKMGLLRNLPELAE